MDEHSGEPEEEEVNIPW